MGLIIVMLVGITIYSIFLMKYCKKNNIKISKWFIVGLYIFAVYLMLVLEITGPATLMDIGRGTADARINLRPFNDLIANRGAGYSLFGLVTNAILFMPLGIILPSLWKKFEGISNTLLAGILVSLTIEIFQLLNIRATDIDDLIMNTAGTIIGYLIYLLIFKRFTSKLKLQEDVNNKPLIKYNAKVFLGTMFALYFFLVPYVNEALFYIIYRR